MKILVELLHPAHVHLFKHAIQNWQSAGHEVLIMSRDKDCSLELIEELGWKHHMLSRKRKPWLAGAFEYLWRVLRLSVQILKHKPDVMTGVMGITIAPLGRLFGIPTCIFYDTEIARISNRIAFACADRVLVPSSFSDMRSSTKLIRYDSFHELAYLHPDLFTIPVRSTSHYAGEGRAKILVRFISSNASHDLGIRDLNHAQKLSLLQVLEIFGEIWISSEAPLPDDLRRKCHLIESKNFHHVLADCDLVVSESATVSSEAAMLGVPAIFVSGSWRGYTNELDEIYGLVQRLHPEKLADLASICLRTLENPFSLYQKRRERLLSEKGNLAQAITKAVESLGPNR